MKVIQPKKIMPAKEAMPTKKTVTNKQSSITKILSACAITLTTALTFSLPSANAGEIVSVPEPMVFDLVRGLGAKQGELEINTLGEFAMNSDGSVEWAPEIEYAIADGIALEFEVPFDGSERESYKFAAQFTHGQSLEHQVIYGSQFLYETFTGEEDKWQFTGLLLVGKRFSDKNSAMFMLGARTTQGDIIDTNNEAIFNVTFFHEFSEKVTLGLENDLAYHSNDQWSLLVMPQVHYELPKNVEVQFGVGVELNDSHSKNEFVTGVRLIKNFDS